MPDKSVLDGHDDNFAIVFAAMGVCIIKLIWVIVLTTGILMAKVVTFKKRAQI